MRVAIAGATGMIGTALAERLIAGGHVVVPISRHPSVAGRGSIAWDPMRGKIDPAALEGLDAVVNLAGAKIAPALWTAKYKALIRDSRVASTALLAETIRGLLRPPRLFLAQSAIGYYGNHGSEDALDESSPPGGGFLPGVCVAWEAAAKPAQAAGVRTVLMRTATVLTPHGGFLALLLPLFRLGLGGRVGSGRQPFSWIALEDWLAAAEFVMAREDLRGPVNFSAPGAVSNAEFTAVLARVLRRPAFLAAPEGAVRAVFGRQMAQEALLGGQRVIPHRLLDSGFVFRFPQLEPTLRAMLM